MRPMPGAMPDPAEIDILIEDPRWQAVGLDTLAAGAAAAALGIAGIGGPREISILAADDARIAALNAAHRGKDGATNVLSWPAEDLAPDMPGARPNPPGLPELGDIALAYETCAGEATAHGIPVSAHVSHLIVHGVLHLLGYDHETDADATLMESLEIKALENMGLHNPYL